MVLPVQSGSVYEVYEFHIIGYARWNLRFGRTSVYRAHGLTVQNGSWLVFMSSVTVDYTTLESHHFQATCELGSYELNKLKIKTAMKQSFVSAIQCFHLWTSFSISGTRFWTSRMGWTSQASWTGNWRCVCWPCGWWFTSVCGRGWSQQERWGHSFFL